MSVNLKVDIVIKVLTIVDTAIQFILKFLTQENAWISLLFRGW